MNKRPLIEGSSVGRLMTLVVEPIRPVKVEHVWHVEAGLKILSASRETREVLPVTRSRVNRAFRSFDEVDLRTTALDVVGVKTV